MKVEIGNDQAVIIDIRQLSFWRLAKPAAIFPVRQTREFQQQHSLDDERAWIGETEKGPECVERDHAVPSAYFASSR